MGNRMNWKNILAEAAAIVQSYDTNVTLRQLFYRLVASQSLPNTTSAYKTLSRRTAEARRDGWFPSLIDPTRSIERPTVFAGPDGAKQWLREIYRRDRTEGQEWSIYLGVEKAGILEQLRSWYWEYGVSIIALRGYSSQSYIDDIRHDVEAQQRPAVLIYAGDFDPSGEDILRDFVERSACFHRVERIALTEQQVVDYALPPQMGKASDSRAAAFVATYGRLVQVELDALPPETLHTLYEDAFQRYWDKSMYEMACDAEMMDVEALSA